MRSELLQKVKKRRTEASEYEIRMNELRQDGIKRIQRMQEQRYQHEVDSSDVTPPSSSSLFITGIQQR